MVVQEKTSSLVVLVQVLNPLPLLEDLGFDSIPLSRAVSSEVIKEKNNKTHPRGFLVEHGPDLIGNGSGIPHCPRGRIKGPIPWPWIDDPMTKEFVQDPLVSGQLLPLWAKVAVETPQRYQGLMPKDIVNRTPRRPGRTGYPLIGMISRRNDLQERLGSLPRREQPHLPVAESNTRLDRHCASPRVVVRSGSLRHGYR